MTEQPAASDLVVITAKRLDSEDADEATVEAAIPATEAGQRAQLTEIVRARYPEAELRSFADEAASFLAPKLLVVASYRRAREAERSDSVDVGSDAQPQLFAA